MAKQQQLTDEAIRSLWHSYMTRGDLPEEVSKPWWTSKRFRHLFRRLPSNPRCSVCYYPFEGVGGYLMRTLFKVKPSRLNPYQCNLCDQFAENHQGGAEVEVTVLFADIRGSTQIAERMNPLEYSRFINRFYNVTTGILFSHGAMLEKIAGDSVTAFFSKGFSGEDHAAVAIETAREIMRETGHHAKAGPWAPLGIGIHTGMSFVGAVRGDSGASHITILGDTPNTGARLCSIARAGEIYISQATAEAAGLSDMGIQKRELELKGRTQRIWAWIL